MPKGPPGGAGSIWGEGGLGVPFQAAAPTTQPRIKQKMDGLSVCVIMVEALAIVWFGECELILYTGGAADP